MTVPLRNSRISLTVCLYILCYEADKPVKTVTDIAALRQTPTEPAPPRLLDQVRARIRVLHYSIRTEQTYVDWIKRYIRFFDKRHPRELEKKKRGRARVLLKVPVPSPYFPLF